MHNLAIIGGGSRGIRLATLTLESKIAKITVMVELETLWNIPKK